FLLGLLLAQSLELVQHVQGALRRRLLDQFLLAEELLVLEHRLDRERLVAIPVDGVEDLVARPPAVQQPVDLPVGVLELAVLHLQGVLDDPLDLAELDLAKDHEVFSKSRTGLGGTVARRQRFGRVFGSDSREEFSRTEDRAQGRIGQTLFQRYRTGLRKRAIPSGTREVATLALPCIPVFNRFA